MKKFTKVLLGLMACGVLLSGLDVYLNDTTKVPNLKMKDTGLSFEEIEGYQNYQIVASHFRKDKNEIRYILANPIAYNALRADKSVMPEGSKIVKIGWSVNDMESFPAALEANKIERVEYMIKDKTKHAESDGWGYARFVKKDGQYKAWSGDPKSCVACHAAVQSNNAVFTKFQRMF
ncbi:MAG: cytochrome P460 family protein [Campylobacterales bacterium]|nr:cytochrome P460 family protein [Campylobacterales bacterium]